MYLDEEDTPDELDLGEIADVVMTAVSEIKTELSD